MQIADLHVHSRFSKATSRDITTENLEKWARIKGINLLGTGDFSHPSWLRELKQELHEDGSGILKTKNGFPFVLSNEVSLMYSQNGKGRRVHLLLLAPSLDTVDQINEYLGKKGRLDYDGRPIFNLTIPELTEGLKSISDEVEIIPAHIWTPWYGLLGSKSGFDSFEEAFQDQLKRIHALETGLSSDPEMNWRLSRLDSYTIVSFSDSHSFWPWRLGREATLFNLKELTYSDLIKAIRTREGYAGTIEVNPAYGKYHFDGHRFCGFSCSPKEAIERNNICPICNKLLTIGVEHRIEELADRPEGFKPKDAVPFKSLLPLHELVALTLQLPMSSKKAWQIYDRLVQAFGNEFNILLNVSSTELARKAEPKLVQAILKNREGKIKIKPGFDGEYGKPIIEEQQKLV